MMENPRWDNRLSDAGLRLSFCTIVCLLLACQTPPDAPQNKSDEIDVDAKKTLDPRKVAAAKKVFRQVLMPSKAPGRHGHGYGNYSFSSGAIRSQVELDDFLGRLESEESTYSFPKLVSPLKDLAIDFDDEVLLLLRHGEGSSSKVVRFGTPSLSLSAEIPKSRKVLTLRIDAPNPPPFTSMNTARAQYCFPVVVDTKLVDMAVLEVEGNVVFAVDFDGALPQFEEHRP